MKIPNMCEMFRYYIKYRRKWSTNLYSRTLQNICGREFIRNWALEWPILYGFWCYSYCWIQNKMKIPNMCKMYRYYIKYRRKWSTNLYSRALRNIRGREFIRNWSLEWPILYGFWCYSCCYIWNNTKIPNMCERLKSDFNSLSYGRNRLPVTEKARITEYKSIISSASIKGPYNGQFLMDFDVLDTVRFMIKWWFQIYVQCSYPM